MTCKEKILSEDFQDILSPYTAKGNSRPENGLYCAIPITDKLWSVYYDRVYLPQLSFADYSYRFVTEVYGLMDVSFPEVSGGGFDPQPLIHSGISAIQRPPLSLTGRNVVIGFADTGDGVSFLHAERITATGMDGNIPEKGPSGRVSKKSGKWNKPLAI